MLLHDIVRSCHAPNGRRHFTQKSIECALSEHIHVFVITVEDLAALRSPVHLIGSNSFLVDESLELIAFSHPRFVVVER